MTVIIGSRIGQRDIFQAQCDRGRLMDFELIDRDQGIILEYPWVHHHTLLQALDLTVRGIGKRDCRERWMVVVKEAYPLCSHYLHEADHLTDFLSVASASAPGDDQGFRMELLEIAENGT